MRIDLERALGSIADAAESSASPVPVGRVLTRMRRRRVGRTVASSAVGLGAVGAIAFGASALTRDGQPGPVTASPPPTVTPSPSPRLSPAPEDAVLPPAVTAAGSFACGAPVPPIDDPAGAGDLHFEPLAAHAPAEAPARPATTDPLDGMTMLAGEDLVLDAVLVNGTAADVELSAPTQAALRVLAVQDGVVVGDVPAMAVLSQAPEVDENGDLVDTHRILAGGPGSRWSQPTGGPLVPCTPSASSSLPAGEYHLYLTEVLFTGADATVPSGRPADLTAVGGPYRLTVEPGSDAPPAEDLVITTSGLGPLTVGQPPDGNPGAAMIRFDPDLCQEMDPSLPGEWRPVLSYERRDADGNPTYPFSVEANEDGVSRIDITSSDPATADGIRIGSTPAELRAAYPDLTGPVAGVSSEVWSRGDASGTLVFEVATSPDAFPDGVTEPTVVSIRVFAPGIRAAFAVWQTDDTAGGC